jgi:hypothetical protein
MDEYDRGFDPELRRYLKRVLNSIFVGMFWILAMMFLGIYFGWAIVYGGKPDLYNLVFYMLFTASLAWLIWYYYRLWKKDKVDQEV